jgi:maltooligosyltrehalose synthase
MAALQTKLTTEDVKTIREAAEHTDKTMPGERYPAGICEVIYGETLELDK